VLTRGHGLQARSTGGSAIPTPRLTAKRNQEAIGDEGAGRPGLKHVIVGLIRPLNECVRGSKAEGVCRSGAEEKPGNRQVKEQYAARSAVRNLCQ
jgi:hypothetical protein